MGKGEKKRKLFLTFFLLLFQGPAKLKAKEKFFIWNLAKVQEGPRI